MAEKTSASASGRNSMRSVSTLVIVVRLVASAGSSEGSPLNRPVVRRFHPYNAAHLVEKGTHFVTNAVAKFKLSFRWLWSCKILAIVHRCVARSLRGWFVRVVRRNDGGAA